MLWYVIRKAFLVETQILFTMQRNYPLLLYNPSLPYNLLTSKIAKKRLPTCVHCHAPNALATVAKSCKCGPSFADMVPVWLQSFNGGSELHYLIPEGPCKNCLLAERRGPHCLGCIFLHGKHGSSACLLCGF